ncbi:hypothetical protein M438DRAFT_342159 [Aureobasidium pullulans EXF-150]|uniref:Uncharacterized protein n=1 Tax=Aureobasidium pullulans EXF-150 TaxID=1043002 RepID=A0A074XSL1_AURPU|nr:uncharacterized protein M438DRAFT_342159 [Aureobasidium pullulans EXF-150]KEQ88583.1 hypothetical protein M438DRAFT_342159 [Aureobasidium pullulans EXF-150]
MVMSRKCVPPLLLHSSMSPATDTDRHSLQSIVKAQGAITNYRPFVELNFFQLISRFIHNLFKWLPPSFTTSPRSCHTSHCRSFSRRSQLPASLVLAPLLNLHYLSFVRGL